MRRGTSCSLWASKASILCHVSITGEWEWGQLFRMTLLWNATSKIDGRLWVWWKWLTRIWDVNPWIWWIHYMEAKPVDAVESMPLLSCYPSLDYGYRSHDYSAKGIDRIPWSDCPIMICGLPEWFNDARTIGTEWESCGYPPPGRLRGIRLGQLTHDEYFFIWVDCQSGVKITNLSKNDYLMLKHFGPKKPGLKVS